MRHGLLIIRSFIVLFGAFFPSSSSGQEEGKVIGRKDKFNIAVYNGFSLTQQAGRINCINSYDNESYIDGFMGGYQFGVDFLYRIKAVKFGIGGQYTTYSEAEMKLCNGKKVSHSLNRIHPYLTFRYVLPEEQDSKQSNTGFSVDLGPSVIQGITGQNEREVYSGSIGLFSEFSLGKVMGILEFEVEYTHAKVEINSDIAKYDIFDLLKLDVGVQF